MSEVVVQPASVQPAGPSPSSCPAAVSTTCSPAGRAACCSPTWRCPGCNRYPAMPWSTLLGGGAAGQRRRGARRPDLQDAVGGRGRNCFRGRDPADPGAAGSPPGSTSRSPSPRCTRPSRRSLWADWRRAWPNGPEVPSSSPAVPSCPRPGGPVGRGVAPPPGRRSDPRSGVLRPRACLELGRHRSDRRGAGQPRAGGVEPFRESGHLLLMRTVAARGNQAEALAAYERAAGAAPRRAGGQSESGRPRTAYARMLE